MAYLGPKELAELQRQIALARKCPSCLYDPVLVVRNGLVEVLAHCKPGCRGSRPVLSLVEGGESDA